MHQLRAFAEQPGISHQVYTDQEPGGKANRSELKLLLHEAYLPVLPRALPQRPRAWLKYRK